jgi:hypothetical protein
VIFFALHTVHLIKNFFCFSEFMNIFVKLKFAFSALTILMSARKCESHKRNKSKVKIIIFLSFEKRMAGSYLDCSWRRSKESEKKCSNNAQDLSELNKKLRKGKFDFYLFEKVFEQCAEKVSSTFVGFWRQDHQASEISIIWNLQNQNHYFVLKVISLK